MQMTERANAESAVRIPVRPLVSVRNLSVSTSHLQLVKGVSFDVDPGERVAMVGESGSGKSVTARALMRLDPHFSLDGVVEMDGSNLLSLSEPEMRLRRGARIGMAFQDSLNALDPLRTIGAQVSETLRIRGVSDAEARRRALRVLDELKVDRAAERLDAYPHEFSGGMRQRVVIAMALVGEPALLIADEPTTALDVRVQEAVLDLLHEISGRRGLALILITHDMGVVAAIADRVLVMYSGRIVEEGRVDAIFDQPSHPYTRGLLKAVPPIDRDLEQLQAIPGTPPDVRRRPSGCAFHPRCSSAMPLCAVSEPLLTRSAATRRACHLET
jgi:peptide/nickel transport system ATP-binding protein/oligopeptide transport system ATP-binding protein